MGGKEKAFIVFKGNERQHPTESVVPYNPVTVVLAEDANDAVTQVASSLGTMGSYVAVECEPVNINLGPARLQIGRVSS